MKSIKKVEREDDVNALKAGDGIFNLRGYHIHEGGIIPVWYFDKTISLSGARR